MDGVAVIAEGVVELLDPSELSDLPNVERDEHGHIRIAEVNIGDLLKAGVQKRLKQYGIKSTVVSKNIGYELRCADPIPFDMEYTRDLGYCAARCVLDGGNGVMISIQNGKFRPIPFAELMDPKTGRTKVRMVDVDSDRYRIANSYMVRLRREDLEHDLARFAALAHITPEAFREEFGYLVQDQPATSLRPPAITVG
jgi:6-phosphofructokinase 1